MIILKLEVDNMYMFNDFNIDFTFPRKIKNTFVEHETLEYAPKIKYKKVNIIMGGNGSGKSTFGKLLLKLNQYVNGHSVNFQECIYDNNKKARLRTLFVSGEFAFELEVILDGTNIYRENLKTKKLCKTYNLQLLEERINNLEGDEFIRDSDIYLEENELKSILLSKQNTDIGKTTTAQYIRDTSSYCFDIGKLSISNRVIEEIKNEDLKTMEKMLKVLDPSIINIKSGQSSDIHSKETNQEKEFYIHFSNDSKVVVPSGDPQQIKEGRISQGTVEAIEMAYILARLDNYSSGAIYIDEKMSHMHTELERCMISKFVATIKGEAQLFITTHNENCLELNFPLHSFTFFVRDNEGIKTVNPEMYVMKNDRSLITYVQNNVFGTIPDYGELWDE